MSAIKNILAVVDDATSSRITLQAALKVARHLGSRLEALHVRPDPVAALPLVGEAMSGTMVEEMMTIAARDADARAAAVRAVYDEVTARAGIGGAWIEDVGAVERVLALRACRGDLLMVARPEPETETVTLPTVNAALLQSGRPVLVVPPGDMPPGFSRVALFWNGSIEATRAVAAALPFLVAAEQVLVLRVEEEEWFAPTDDLESYLANHGVKAVVSQVLPRNAPTGEALLAAAHANNAHLMIMGAYTRSKLRQLILGSVTGHVMRHATLPVLLSH